MRLIDTHAHLTYSPLADQLDQVLNRSRDAGVTGWIAVGTGPQENLKTLGLTDHHENLWAALGYHPHHADEISPDDLAGLRELAQREKVVAIGETGLDYHYMYAKAENQKRIFQAHLEIAAEADKPVVIHTRQAFDDTMAVLADYRDRIPKVVIHCYGGDQKQTELALNRGYYFSFTGIVTFKKADDLRKVVKMIPIDRVMIETDCPYISPEPVRKIQPNEPALLVHTAAKMAEIYGLSPDQFARQVTDTSRSFFHLNQ